MRYWYKRLNKIIYIDLTHEILVQEVEQNNLHWPNSLDIGTGGWTKCKFVNMFESLSFELVQYNFISLISENKNKHYSYLYHDLGMLYLH